MGEEIRYPYDPGYGDYPDTWHRDVHGPLRPFHDDGILDYGHDEGYGGSQRHDGRRGEFDKGREHPSYSRDQSPRAPSRHGRSRPPPVATNVPVPTKASAPTYQNHVSPIFHAWEGLGSLGDADGSGTATSRDQVPKATAGSQRHPAFNSCAYEAEGERDARRASRRKSAVEESENLPHNKAKRRQSNMQASPSTLSKTDQQPHDSAMMPPPPRPTGPTAPAAPQASRTSSSSQAQPVGQIGVQDPRNRHVLTPVSRRQTTAADPTSMLNAPAPAPISRRHSALETTSGPDSTRTTDPEPSDGRDSSVHVQGESHLSEQRPERSATTQDQSSLTEGVPSRSQDQITSPEDEIAQCQPSSNNTSPKQGDSPQLHTQPHDDAGTLPTPPPEEQRQAVHSLSESTSQDQSAESGQQRSAGTSDEQQAHTKEESTPEPNDDSAPAEPAGGTPANEPDPVDKDVWTAYQEDTGDPKTFSINSAYKNLGVKGQARRLAFITSIRGMIGFERLIVDIIPEDKYKEDWNRLDKHENPIPRDEKDLSTALLERVAECLQRTKLKREGGSDDSLSARDAKRSQLQDRREEAESALKQADEAVAQAEKALKQAERDRESKRKERNTRRKEWEEWLKRDGKQK